MAEHGAFLQTLTCASDEHVQIALRLGSALTSQASSLPRAIPRSSFSGCAPGARRCPRINLSCHFSISWLCGPLLFAPTDDLFTYTGLLPTYLKPGRIFTYARSDPYLYPVGNTRSVLVILETDPVHAPSASVVSCFCSFHRAIFFNYSVRD